MSKLTDAARELPDRKQRVINSYDFYRPLAPVVFITYSPQQTGRAYEAAKFVVSAFNSKGEQVVTDPGAHWRDHNRKTFPLYHGFRGGTLKEARAVVLAEAQAWVDEKYGKREWAKDPWGSWGPAEKIKTRVKEIREAVAAHQAAVAS